MKKQLLLSLYLFISCFVCYAQQDALYSQYMQNPLTINPAYTGIYNMFSTTAVSRWQWVGMEGAPKTNSLTAHSTIAQNKLGVGMILLNDQFGASSNSEAHATVSYKIRLSDNEEEVLSFGMQAGIIHYSTNNSALRLKYDDPNFSPGQLSATKPNFGSGIYYKNKKMYLSFSVPKLLNNSFGDGTDNVIHYKRHFFLGAGYLIDLSSVVLKPSVLVKYVNGAPVSVDLNGSVLLKDFIWLGASVRNLNTLVLMTQLQLNDRFRVGYALDLPTTSVLKTSYGTHELMLNIDLKLFKSHDIGLRYF